MATYQLTMASQANNESEGKEMRERMITRTVVSTEYVVMVVNMETRQVEDMNVSIPSAENMTTKKRDELIRSAIPEGKSFVSVLGQELKETLYGMSEAEFIKLARVLPPRTKSE